MPCTSCLYGKWLEDVCVGQFGVFLCLVLRCLLGCCTWFSCCAANVGLSICVRYCHVRGFIITIINEYYYSARGVKKTSRALNDRKKIKSTTVSRRLRTGDRQTVRDQTSGWRAVCWAVVWRRSAMRRDDVMTLWNERHISLVHLRCYAANKL